ncbi:hypothetical protein EOW65_02655 [Sinirhodobacter ferrireducens]|uniref:Uncharacterized protein n=1 Tax=Paenirhodobacter ferrireducens TaxID=1215032 RepID=A0A443LTN2_9RHOB|nr:hypothetical protein [Sinirhodobacter ferrireducens]RWR52492.1 hypothetical protein EOW65_02655 [Sinirhodobacter ferrireducens]
MSRFFTTLGTFGELFIQAALLMLAGGMAFLITLLGTQILHFVTDEGSPLAVGRWAQLPQALLSVPQMGAMLGVWCLVVLALPSRPAVTTMTDIAGEGIAFLAGIVAGAATFLAVQDLASRGAAPEPVLTAFGLRLAILYGAACVVMWLPGMLARLSLPGWQRGILLLALVGLTLASVWQP